MAGVVGLVFITLAIFVKSFLQSGELAGGMVGDSIGPGSSAGLVEYSGMPLYNLIFGAIHTLPILNRIVTIGLILALCYMLVRIGVRYMLLDFRSLMPGVFFVFFTVALPFSQQVSPALVGSIFYLFCFAILFDVHDKRPDTFSIFIASLVLVLGSMFYLKLIWFVPVIWISLWTLRTVTWRELFYPVIAYLLLGLLLFTWYWGVQNDSQEFMALIRGNLSFEGGYVPHHYSVYIYYGYLLLLVLVASIYMLNRFQSRKTVIQNIYQALFFMFLASILFYHFVTRLDTTALPYLTFPVTFILAYYFHRKRNSWGHELALWILVGLLVYAQLML